MPNTLNWNDGTPAPQATPSPSASPQGALNWNDGTPSPSPQGALNWNDGTAAPSPTPSAKPKGDAWVTAGLPSVDTINTGATKVQNAVAQFNRATVDKVDTSLLTKIESGSGKTWDAATVIEGTLQRLAQGVFGGDPDNPDADFWQRTHAAYNAALHYNKFYDERQQELIMKEIYGPEYAQLKADKARYAAAYALMMVGTDPLSYLGIGILPKIGLLRDAKLAKPLIGAWKAISESKTAGPIAKYLAGMGHKFVSAIHDPSHLQMDRNGNPVQAIPNFFMSIFHPYTPHRFTWNDIPSEHLVDERGVKTSAYHAMQALSGASAGLGARVERIWGDVIDRVRGDHMQAGLAEAMGKTLPYKKLADAKDINGVDDELRALTYTSAHWFGDESMKKQAMLLSKREGLDITKYPAWNEFKKLDEIYNLAGLHNYRVRKGYVPAWEGMENFVNSHHAGEDIARAFQKAESMKSRNVFSEFLTGEKPPKRRSGGPSFESRKKINKKGEVRFPDDPIRAYETRALLDAQVGARRFLQRGMNDKLGLGGYKAAGQQVLGHDLTKLKAHLNPDLWQTIGTPNSETDAWLQTYMSNPNQHILKWVEGFSHWMEDAPVLGSFLKGMSSAMTKGITNNSLPHTFNTERLTWLAGGPRALFNQAKMAVTKGIPHDLDVEMSRHGYDGTFEYMPNKAESSLDLSGAMSHFPILKQWNNANHGMLRNVYKSAWAAVYTELKRRYPEKSLDEIGHLTAEGIGGYKAAPALIKLLRVWGGMFPLWHLRTVMATTAKAAVKDPGRIGMLMHADQALDKSDPPWKQPGNRTAHPFSGSAYDASKELDSVLQFIAHADVRDMRYLTSASSIGLPLSNLLKYSGEKYGPIRAVEETAIEQATASMGITGVPLGEGLNPYGDKQPFTQRVLQSYFGIYPEYDQTFWNEVARYRALPGVSEYAAMRMAIRSTQVMQGR